MSEQSFFYEFMSMFAGISVNVLEAEHKFTIFVWGASINLNVRVK